MLRHALIATSVAWFLSNAFAQAPMTQFCFPGQGGVIQCPCGNPPAGGGFGCNNFGNGPIQSGTLDATGNASLLLDTVLLRATGENAKARTRFYTATNVSPTGIPFAAGVRCVTGQLKLLYPAPQPYPAPPDLCKSSGAGAISRPLAFTSDPPVSVRSAKVGAPIVAGQTRYYFCAYEDPLAAVPCGNSASVMNTTNAGAITWGP